MEKPKYAIETIEGEKVLYPIISEYDNKEEFEQVLEEAQKEKRISRVFID